MELYTLQRDMKITKLPFTVAGRDLDDVVRFFFLGFDLTGLLAALFEELTFSVALYACCRKASLSFLKLSSMMSIVRINAHHIILNDAPVHGM